jgi:hypothetical protein
MRIGIIQILDVFHCLSKFFHLTEHVSLLVCELPQTTSVKPLFQQIYSFSESICSFIVDANNLVVERFILLVTLASTQNGLSLAKCQHVHVSLQFIMPGLVLS